MRRCSILLFFVALLLSGCAADQSQIEVCRQAFEVLLGQSVVMDAPTADGEGTVELTGRSGGEHHLVCRFGGAPLTPRHLDLLAVELDGESEAEVSLIVLRHALGLPMPEALFDRPAPPMPFDLQAAYFAQQLINGLATGAILALIATGYSLIYGITDSIQFAYGEVVTIGAFLFVIPFYAFVVLGMPGFAFAMVLALPCAIAGTSVYGWTVSRLLYRPLLRASRLNALIAAIGVGMALREYVRLTQGKSYKWIPSLLADRVQLFTARGFGVSIGKKQLLIIGLAMLFAAALAWLLRRTSWGRTYRACADDSGMAALLGIDLFGTIDRTLVIGAGLAAVSGACFALQYGEADAYMGFVMGMKALTAAVLGGLGTVTGALAGGIAVGLFEALWAGYFSSAYKDAAVFSLLAIVLVLRPEGLFGFSAASASTAQPTALRRP